MRCQTFVDVLEHVRTYNQAEATRMLLLSQDREGFNGYMLAWSAFGRILNPTELETFREACRFVISEHRAN